MLCSPSGPLRCLVEWRGGDPEVRDVQLRGAGNQAELALYVGLTKVLGIRGTSESLGLHTHPTHQSNGPFDPAWLKKRPVNDLIGDLPRVLAYLAELKVGSRHRDAEGLVHAALCSGQSDEFFVIDREAEIGFPSIQDRAQVCGGYQERVWEVVDALESGGSGWASRRALRLGKAADALAIDRAGRLLVIEAKPARGNIDLAAGQVTYYAELFARWLRVTAEASAILDRMLSQRIELGLTRERDKAWVEPTTVVPVLAVGSGDPPSIARCRQFALALETAGRIEPTVAPLEAWFLDRNGEPSSTLRFS